MSDRAPLPPGSTIGLLGGGQLGRMIALEGRSLGYRFACWDPKAGAPAEPVCDKFFVAPFNDEAAAKEFSRVCDLVTWEWENVPAELVARLASEKRVRPEPGVLAVIQDRLAQREWLAKHKFPQTDFRRVSTPPDLDEGLKQLGYPAILKTRRHGYDGKGQVRFASAADMAKAIPPLHDVLEKHVPFAKEISVILARAETGETAVYPIAENTHVNGILHTTVAPARIPATVAKEAALLALSVAAALNYVGVMAVEMFWLGGDGNGQLLINEIAPRVHNSGHYTWGACRTSQFEQHVRAVAGLPLGDTTQHTPAVMLNVLGDLWLAGDPEWAAWLSKGAKLYLYGKSDPARGRKMGHLLLLGDVERSLALIESVSRR